MSIWYPAAMAEQIRVHYKTDSMYLTACKKRSPLDGVTSIRKDVTCSQCRNILLLKGRA